MFVMGESPDFAPFRFRLSHYGMGMDDSVADAATQALADLLFEMELRGYRGAGRQDHHSVRRAIPEVFGLQSREPLRPMGRRGSLSWEGWWVHDMAHRR